MTKPTIAIVGATGKTGSRVFNQLQQQGYPVRGLGRSSGVYFDWSDPDSWAAALEGVDAAYVTYFPDLAVPRAEADLRQFVAVAKEQQVKHLVLLSGRGEEGARRAEQVVETSGLNWNVVRASWFLQNFSESFMLEGLQSGRLFLPEAKVKEPFIDADDIAEVAVAALTRPELVNQLFEVTGPELVSFTDCVEAIAKSTSRDLSLQALPVDDYLAAAKANGMSEDMLWLLRELFVQVLDGRNEYTTDVVERVLGRPAGSLQNYVDKAAATGVWSES